MTGWDLTYTAFVSPVSVAFSSTDHVDGLVGVDIAASALYFIDLAMNFSVGYVVQTFDGHQIGKFTFNSFHKIARRTTNSSCSLILICNRACRDP